MKKIVSILLVAVLISSLGLVGCKSKETSTTSTNKLTKVRIGADSAVFSLQFRVAEKEGYFEKNGIEAEISTFSFGIDTLNALVLDQVDTAEAMDFATGTRLANSNFKIISLLSSPSEKNGNLYVTGDIEKPEDLVGKNIGVAKGTVNEYIWAKLFEKYNIDPKAVNLKYLQSSQELITALDTGDVDAIWSGGALTPKIEAIKGVKSLGDYSLINFRMRGYFILSDKFITAHPEAVSKILKALDEATAFIKKNPEEAAQIAFDELKVPKEDVLSEITSNWDYDIRFSQEDFDHINNVVSWSIDNGLIKEQFEVKDYVNLEPLKKILPDKVTYKP